MGRRSRRAALAAAFLPCLAAGQVEGARDTASFEDTVEVRLAVVDVTVTGKNGAPVTALTAADFVVEIDGRSAEVVSFYEEESRPDDGRALPTPVPAAATAQDAVTASAPPSVGVPSDPSAIVVHFDHRTLRSFDITRALPRIEAFVERARLATGAPVWATQASRRDGLRLARLDAPIAEGALAATIDAEQMEGMLSLTQRRGAMRAMVDMYKSFENSPGCAGPCECAWQPMLGIWDSYSADLGDRLERSMGAVDELVASLGAVEGRKALLLVSAGIEQRPGLDLLRYMSDICPEYEREFESQAWRHDLSGTLVRLAGSANASRVTLHTLDAGGMTTSEAADTSFAEATFRPSRQGEFMYGTNLDAGLAFLAHDTGGAAILNTNLMADDDLAPVESALGHYYSLGVRLAGPADGETHEIRVELARKKRGTTLAYRRQYLDKLPTHRDAEAALAFLHWQAGGNPLAVRVGLGPASPGEPGPSAEVSEAATALHVLIPVNRLSPLDPGTPISVPVVVAVHDLTHGRTLVRTNDVHLEPPGADAELHDLVIDLDLEPGSYRFAVAVRHPLDGTLSFAQAEGRIE